MHRIHIGLEISSSEDMLKKKRFQLLQHFSIRDSGMDVMCAAADVNDGCSCVCVFTNVKQEHINSKVCVNP